MNNLMCRESERLKTFNSKNWKAEYFDKVVLAKEGFFFLDDIQTPGTVNWRVECYCCGIRHTVWLLCFNVPSVYHRRKAPRCPFAVGEVAGNITVEAEARENEKNARQKEKNRKYRIM